jgi:twitching motility two-component system response regulator PilH
MATILVVDDSPTETHQFAAALARQGHEVLTAASGNDGIDLATVEQPDVILMDVVMPGINGFQATRQLTRGEDTRHIPVIIVSSKSQDADRVWGERQGACGYLTKPVDDRTLINTVNDALRD